MNIEFLVLAVIALVAVSEAQKDIHREDSIPHMKSAWDQFHLSHKRTYRNQDETEKRFKIFGDNVRSIIASNEQFRNGQVSFEQEINEFADMKSSEVDAQLNGFDLAMHQRLYGNSSESYTKSHRRRRDLLPTDVNWVTKGAVGPVLHQGKCGCCWAFATVACIEALHYVQTGRQLQLSQQELIDCSTTNNGCNGGILRAAYDFVISNGGLSLAHDYPYLAQQYMCKYCAPRATVKSIASITYQDEQQLKQVVATVGPVSVAIDASLSSFRFYSKGIYYDAACTTGNVNHAVVVVGYGTDNSTDYWLVRNSWGPNWGENGYIRMARNRQSHCCIACYGSYPTS